MNILKILQEIDNKGMYLDMLSSDIELIYKEGKEEHRKCVEQAEIVGGLSAQIIEKYGSCFIASTIKEVKFMILDSQEFKDIDTPTGYQRTVMELLTKIETAFLFAQVITEHSKNEVIKAILTNHNVQL